MRARHRAYDLGDNPVGAPRVTVVLVDGFGNAAALSYAVVKREGVDPYDGWSHDRTQPPATEGEWEVAIREALSGAGALLAGALGRLPAP